MLSTCGWTQRHILVIAKSTHSPKSQHIPPPIHHTPTFSPVASQCDTPPYPVHTHTPTPTHHSSAFCSCSTRNLLPSLEMLHYLFIPAAFWGPKPGLTSLLTKHSSLSFLSIRIINQQLKCNKEKTNIPVWPTSLEVTLFFLLPVPAAVCLCLWRMKWFQEHAAAGEASNGLEIKLHQNKQQLRRLSGHRHLPQTGQWKDLICSGLPVTFSSSIKPFTDYPSESREGKQTPTCPLGRGNEEVLAFPQVAERVRWKVNNKMQSQGKSTGQERDK